MKKEIDIKRKAHLYPTPVVVVGTKGKDGRIDWSTVAYTGIADSNHIVISVGVNHQTAVNIRENGKCSINIPSSKDARLVDKVGCISGVNNDKSSAFRTCYGNDSDIPLIEDFPLSIECTLEKNIDVDGHNMFYLRCNHIWIDDEKKPEVKDIDPLLFAWEAYFTVGNIAGKPWSMN